MITFEDRVGPARDVTYPTADVPDWWRDSKFGLFVHWGIYSVPAWATPVRDERHNSAAYTHHPYAEWYANTVRIAGSPTAAYHRRHFGERDYEELLDQWDPDGYDPDALLERFSRWGARYAVLTTKHHDGCCLWDTATTDYNTARRGPRRDLVSEFARAARDHRVRFGVYFSGALDWHQSTFPPITSDEELFSFRRNDPAFAELCAAQLSELIDTFQPDVLWNDIDWPDGGKGDEAYSLGALLRHYYEMVPDGVINDRWGIPFHGHLTREYREIRVEPEPWEATRGVGRSFGYNRDEDLGQSLSGAEAIRLLVRTVAAGGNLLLNTGLTATGEVPAEQAAVLDEVGEWLRTNGEAVYGTRAPQPLPVDSPMLTTAGQDDARYVFVMDPGAESRLPASLAGETVRSLDGATVAVEDGVPLLPEALRAQPVAVLRVERP